MGKLLVAKLLVVYFFINTYTTKFSYNLVKIRYMLSTNYAYSELKREVPWNS